MKFTVLWDEFVALSPPTYFFNFGNIVHFLTPLSETEQLLVFCVSLLCINTVKITVNHESTLTHHGFRDSYF